MAEPATSVTAKCNNRFSAWLALSYWFNSNRNFAASSNINNNKSNNCVTVGLVRRREPRGPIPTASSLPAATSTITKATIV